MKHYIYASPTEGDWVYGGPVRGDQKPFHPGCMVAVFDDCECSASQKCFNEMDSRNRARHYLRDVPPAVDYPVPATTCSGTLGPGDGYQVLPYQDPAVTGTGPPPESGPLRRWMEGINATRPPGTTALKLDHPDPPPGIQKWMGDLTSGQTGTRDTCVFPRTRKIKVSWPYWLTALILLGIGIAVKSMGY